jgi:ATP-dependent RNA helicase RhlE
VATPGRLEDHLKSGNLSLDHTETLILDEADQMLDLGFFPAIRRIAKKTPRTRQTVLLSATMPKPIRALAAELLDNPKDVAVAPASTPVERIEQAVMLMEKPEKRPFLVQALEGQFRTIIFTRTKHGADQLVKYLSKQKIIASAIHGNKSQNQRQRTLQAFRKGEEHILIATDIAARGIDIPDVSLVVNYDMPTTPEAYVHRIGRTARAGREGRAIALCAPEEQKHLRDIEKLIKIKLPVENVRAGGTDDDGYDPMQAAAKPAGRSSAKPVKKTERKDDGESRSPKSRRRGDAKKHGAGGFEDKKSGPRKPKQRHRGDTGSADGQGAPGRKKGGNKNPPRGPARNRSDNRQNSRHAAKPAR